MPSIGTKTIFKTTEVIIYLLLLTIISLIGYMLKLMNGNKVVSDSTPDIPVKNFCMEKKKFFGDRDLHSLVAWRIDILNH